jgi:hypothetical protein
MSDMKAKIRDHLIVRLGDIFGKPKNADRLTEELAGGLIPA